MEIEIGGMVAASTQRDDIVVGIDLGTTYSLVAAVIADANLHPVSGVGATGDSGIVAPAPARPQPRVLADPAGRRLTPSWVTFDDEGGAWIGWEGRARSVGRAERSIWSVKRLMGRGFEETAAARADLPYPTVPDERGAAHGEGHAGIGIPISGPRGARLWRPHEISALILLHLKHVAEGALKQPVKRAVITVPAYFNDSQRHATKEAGRIAGLEVLRIVNEPTAAALAYGLGKREGETIAVYDLGGGTFDVSILRIEKGVFQVLATGGDTRLGGDDFDRALMDVVLDECPDTLAANIRRQPEWSQALRFAATEAKHALTTDDATTLRCALPAGPTLEIPVTRDQFEQVIAPIVERTLGPCRRALHDAGVEPTALDEVVLVGGSTRVPLVRRAVAAFFDKTPHAKLNPDEVVALGAAVQADVLSGHNRDLLLLDVTPLSLGIETYGGGFSRLIERNSTLPAVVRETFTNFADGQNAVDIHVLQGEREMAADNRSLARFALTGLAPLPAGHHRIEVAFLIDANGILSVSATDLNSGKEATVEVKPTFGIGDDDVDRVLEEAFDHAEADIHARMLAEARIEADRVVAHYERQSPHLDALTDAAERARIAEALADLKTAMGNDDPDAIRQAIEQFDEATQPFAQRLMNATLRDALADRPLAGL